MDDTAGAHVHPARAPGPAPASPRAGPDPPAPDGALEPTARLPGQDADQQCKWHDPVGPDLKSFIRARKEKDYTRCNYVVMNGVLGGKFAVLPEDTDEFVRELAAEFVYHRGRGRRCIPLPIVERRTDVYRLFHDIDVSTEHADYFDRILVGERLERILRAHCEVFGLRSVEALVYTSIRRKPDGLWKVGVHLYFTHGTSEAGQRTPILVDKELATKAVFHTRHVLGEPLQDSATQPSIIDRCVHDENGLRIPFVGKSDQINSCPHCYPPELTEETAVLARHAPDVLSLAGCPPVRKWVRAGLWGKGRTEQHKFIAGIAAYNLPTDCGPDCGCRWRIWNRCHEFRSAHGPCYQGKRLILDGYTPRLAAFYSTDGGMELAKYEIDTLDIPTIERLLRDALIRSEATAPTVSLAPGLATAATLDRLWSELDSKRKGKPAAQTGEEGAERAPGQFRTTIPGFRLNEAIKQLGEDPRFRKRFPHYAPLIAQASAKQMGPAPSPVMLAWTNQSPPCPVSRKPHKSNRPYLLISGLSCVLRCMDPACIALVAGGARKWPGLKGHLLPVEDAGDTLFSDHTTSYPMDEFSRYGANPMVKRKADNSKKQPATKKKK